MLTINKLIPGSRGLAAVLLRRAASLELSWDARQKSRFDAVDSSGRVLGVFLPPATVLRGGDALVAEDGSLIKVLAASQPVLVVRPCAEHGSTLDLLRAAYHLGQRHALIELQADCLLLQPDPELAAWLRGMHLIVGEQESAFEPEAQTNAAGHARTHGAGHGDHGHGHGHGDAHDHAHGHAHPTAEPAAPGVRQSSPIAGGTAPHVHGPGCGHDHGDTHRH